MSTMEIKCGIGLFEPWSSRPKIAQIDKGEFLIRSWAAARTNNFSETMLSYAIQHPEMDTVIWERADREGELVRVAVASSAVREEVRLRGMLEPEEIVRLPQLNIQNPVVNRLLPR